ncbi:DHHC palmitoyltransferase-domain-containing protein [Chytriomyces sp. MP71]|nr:DHHC palmitoyltransferase-domain-containing protein [Chytriomyces sp. MP71]
MKEDPATDRDDELSNPYERHIACPRSNGLSFPPDPRQLFMLFFISFSTGVLFGVADKIPLTSLGLIFLQAWMGLLFSIVFIAGFSLSASNPVDPSVLRVWKFGVQGPREWEDAIERGAKYCVVCKAHVEEESLHCKYCDKCIPRLDHHCFYVNNCIGRKNYTLYVFGLVSLFAFSASHFVVASIALVYAFQNDVQALLGFNTYVWKGLVVATVLLSFVFTVFTGDLIRLHVLLYLNGMTTLEYSKYLMERTGSKTMSVGQLLCPKKNVKKIVEPESG